jgi:hypothetical protein
LGTIGGGHVLAVVIGCYSYRSRAFERTRRRKREERKREDGKEVLIKDGSKAGKETSNSPYLQQETAHSGITASVHPVGVLKKAFVTSIENVAGGGVDVC